MGMEWTKFLASATRKAEKIGISFSELSKATNILTREMEGIKKIDKVEP